MQTVFGIKNFTHVEEVPAITQDVLDKGVVLVYAKLKGYIESIWPEAQVGLLPVSLVYVQGATVTDTWSARCSAQSLTISFINNGNIYNSISSEHEFRYVIIPGGVADAGGRVATLTPDYIAHLKSLSYEQVTAELGIPE